MVEPFGLLFAFGAESFPDMDLLAFGLDLVDPFEVAVELFGLPFDFDTRGLGLAFDLLWADAELFGLLLVFDAGDVDLGPFLGTEGSLEVPFWLLGVDDLTAFLGSDGGCCDLPFVFGVEAFVDGFP